MANDFHVVWNRLPQLTTIMVATASRIVRKVTFDLAADAQTHAPVDTGYLANSIQASLITPSHGRVTVGASYGIYVDKGTVHMPARPFFTRAIENASLDQIGAALRALR